MANRTASFRFPVELVEAIEAQAKATGQSKTNVVIAALAKVYGWSQPSPQSVTPEQLQQQLNELKQQIEILMAANALHKLITSADAPIKLGPEVDAVISSKSLEDRLAWVNRVLTEAARKDLEFRLIHSGQQSASRLEKPDQQLEIAEQIAEQDSAFFMPC